MGGFDDAPLSCLAEAGKTGSLSRSRASCWIMTVALAPATIFLTRSSDASVYSPIIVIAVNDFFFIIDCGRTGRRIRHRARNLETLPAGIGRAGVATTKHSVSALVRDQSLWIDSFTPCSHFVLIGRRPLGTVCGQWER
jgi:hypothetical protein